MRTPKDNTKKMLKFIAAAGCALALSISSRATCLTTSIDISTGLNATTGTLYAYSLGTTVVRDGWWQVTMAPFNTIGYTAPQCATLVDDSMVTSGGMWAGFANTPTAGSPLGSHYISFISKCQEEPTGAIPTASSGSGFLWTYYWGTPYGPNTDDSGRKRLPIRFTRKFYIAGSDSQTVTINLAGYGDDIIFAAVDGTPGVPLFVSSTSPAIPSSSAPYYLYYKSDVSTTTIPMSVTQSYRLAPGAHTIDIDLYDVAGRGVGLNVMGNITCAVPELMESTCYGQNKCDSQTTLADNLTSQMGSNMLYQNTPNPVSGQTTIGYFVHQIQQNAFIVINDMNGTEIRRYPITAIGRGQITVNMNNLLPGMYVYALIVDNRQFDIKKMTVL
ncbi:MAG: T9SS type A sorting domain-containing protein [Flavipsychrobacter sp.]